MKKTIEPELRIVHPSDTQVKHLISKLNSFNLSLYSADYCHLESPEQLISNRATMAGAYVQHQLVGIGAVKQMNGYSEVKRMFVDDLFRGTGVAEKILKKLELIALEKGDSIIRLETGSKHTAALNFYTRMGYYRIRQFGNYPVNEVSVLMEKVLES